MKELLIKQMQFEHWANIQLLKNLKQANPLSERALVLFSHLLNASNMWLSRLNNEVINTTLFQHRTIEECEILFETNTRDWQNYLSDVSTDELNNGIQFASPVDNAKRTIIISDAIMHVVHHSSYHRGQIITLLKGTIEQLPLITYMPFASKVIEN